MATRRARGGASALPHGLMWHAGAFAILNAFFWILDALGPGGLTWALWITLFWGLALAFHALAYVVDGRGVEERLTARFERTPPRGSARSTR